MANNKKLLTEDEFDSQFQPIQYNSDTTSTYTGKWSIQKYSAPLYSCPHCKEGGMCRDETIILTSCIYKCNKCGFLQYK